MPYILTHTLFGYEALKALELDPEQASPSFYLGCCGPDPYFFYQPLKSLIHRKEKRDLGHLMHSLPGNQLFAAMLPAIDQVEQDFLRGMVCHLCLDAAAHPYITSRAHGMDHSRMEVEMDMQVYATAADKILTPCQRQAEADLDRLDLYMSRTTEKLTGQAAPGVYKAAARSFLTLQKLSYDPKGSKRKVISVLEKPFARPGTLSGFMLTEGIEDVRDAMNSNHTPWRATRQPELVRRESFMELYKQGLEEAVRCLKVLNQGDIEAFMTLVSKNCMEYGPIASVQKEASL